MRKIAFIAAALVFAGLCGCRRDALEELSENGNSAYNDTVTEDMTEGMTEEITEITTEEITEITTEKITESTTVKITVGMTENVTENCEKATEMPMRIILTNDDILIINGGGYFEDTPPKTLITDEKQLARLPKNFRDMLPDDFEEKYPLSDYVYLAEQKNVSSGGYFYEADSVIIDGDSISFGLSDRCCEPKKGQAVPCIMGGFSFFCRCAEGIYRLRKSLQRME